MGGIGRKALKVIKSHFGKIEGAFEDEKKKENAAWMWQNAQADLEKLKEIYEGEKQDEGPELIEEEVKDLKRDLLQIGLRGLEMKSQNFRKKVLDLYSYDMSEAKLKTEKLSEFSSALQQAQRKDL